MVDALLNGINHVNTYTNTHTHTQINVFMLLTNCMFFSLLFTSVVHHDGFNIFTIQPLIKSTRKSANDSDIIKPFSVDIFLIPCLTYLIGIY